MNGLVKIHRMDDAELGLLKVYATTIMNPQLRNYVYSGGNQHSWANIPVGITGSGGFTQTNLNKYKKIVYRMRVRPDETPAQMRVKVRQLIQDLNLADEDVRKFKFRQTSELCR